MNPLVLSICIPTYNRVQHLKRLLPYFENEIIGNLESVVEVVISNNASTDNTHDYLSEYENKYSWLRINNNKQNVGARNNFLLLQEMAVGSYIWLPGDDDYLKIGLIKKIVECIDLHRPNYIYINRRTICENTKVPNVEGKRHCVDYDKIIDINHRQLVNLVYENFDDLKFQTSSVFRKDLVDLFESEFMVYAEDVRADCHSLFKAIRSIQKGKSYFFSEVCILSGDLITWGKNRVHFLSECDPAFIYGLEAFGFSKSECNSINNRLHASVLFTYIQNYTSVKEWINRGMPNFKVVQIFIIIKLIIRKIFRVFGLSTSHYKTPVNLKDYNIIDQNDNSI